MVKTTARVDRPRTPVTPKAPRAAATPAKSSRGVQQQRQTSAIDVSASKPAPQGTLPEVRGLILKYKPSRGSEVSRPAERVLKTVAAIDALLAKSSDPKELAKLMVENDLRTPLFRLEGLLRLYEPKFGHRFEKRLDKVKDLEDQLGAVGFARDALAVAEKAKLPAPALELLRDALSEQQQALEELVEKRWLPDPGKRGQVDEIDQLVGTLMDAEFGSHAADQKYLRSELASRMQKIVDTKYDFTELQLGVHELRRDLRWLPIYMHSLDGAVQLSEEKNPVPALKKLLATPEANGKFLQTGPADREPSQIVLSKSLLIAHCNQIAALGSFKDNGEYFHALTEALVESKAVKSHEKAEAMVAAALGKNETSSFLEKSRESYEGYVKSGALPALVAELKG